MYISLRRAPRADHDRTRGDGAVPRTVVTLGVVSLLTDVSSESVAAILPLFVTAGLGLSLLTYSLLDGLYQGVGTLSRLPGGWLADRLDRPKPVALSGYVLSALTRVGLLAVSGLVGLASLLALDRVGKGLRTGPRDSLVVLATPAPGLGRAFGVHRALDTLGACLGPLVAFAVLAMLPGNFQAVFVVSLAFAVLGVLVFWLLVPGLRPVSGGVAGGMADATQARPRLSWRAVAPPPVRRMLVGAAVLSGLAIGDGLLYLTLLERDHVEALWLPLLPLASSLVYMVLAVPVGAFADRWGRLRMFYVGHLAIAVAYLAVAGPGWAPGAALGTTVLVVVALGVYYACTDGVLAAAAGSLATTGAVASTISLAQTVETLARAGASLVFGIAWTALGPMPALLAFAGCLLVAVPVTVVLLKGDEQ